MSIVPEGKSSDAVCARTGLTIPECSCGPCLEDQVRRFMPVLLEREPQPAPPATVAPPGEQAQAPSQRPRRWRAAA